MTLWRLLRRDYGHTKQSCQNQFLILNSFHHFFEARLLCR